MPDFPEDRPAPSAPMPPVLHPPGHRPDNSMVTTRAPDLTKPVADPAPGPTTSGVGAEGDPNGPSAVADPTPPAADPTPDPAPASSAAAAGPPAAGGRPAPVPPTPGA